MRRGLPGSHPLVIPPAFVACPPIRVEGADLIHQTLRHDGNSGGGGQRHRLRGSQLRAQALGVRRHALRLLLTTCRSFPMYDVQCASMPNPNDCPSKTPSRSSVSHQETRPRGCCSSILQGGQMARRETGVREWHRCAGFPPRAGAPPDAHVLGGCADCALPRLQGARRRGGRSSTAPVHVNDGHFVLHSLQHRRVGHLGPLAQRRLHHLKGVLRVDKPEKLLDVA